MTFDPKRPWTALSTAYKDHEKGPTYYDFNVWRVAILRAAPIRAWHISRTRDPVLRGKRAPDVDVAALIREVRASEALARGEQPSVSLAPGPYHERRRANFAKWLQHIDPHVQALVADRWSGATWAYLRMLQSSARAREIASSPGGAPFVYALSCAHELVLPQPRRFWPFVERLLKKKRRHAVGALGLPQAPSSVEAIGRIPRDQLNGLSLTMLGRALRHDETAKRVFHAERLSLSLLSALTSELLPHMTPALLTDLGASTATGWEAQRPAHELGDALRMAEQAGGKLGALSSVFEIQVVHDIWVARARKLAQQAKGPLPPMPITLTASERRMMTPLPTFEALYAEGEEMHHCLGTLDHQLDLARAGRFYAFSLTFPERATLAVRREHDGPWVLYDVSGPCNAAVSDAMQRAAYAMVERFERARTEPRQLVMDLSAT